MTKALLLGCCLTVLMLAAPLAAEEAATAAPAATASEELLLAEGGDDACAAELALVAPESPEPWLSRADRPVCCTAAKKQACASNCAAQGCTGWTTSCATDICRCFCSGCP